MAGQHRGGRTLLRRIPVARRPVHRVEARVIGFQPTSRPGVVLSLADRERVDFQLVSSIVTLPEIAVSAAADDRINPGRTGPAQTFTDTLISRLPVVRRNFYHLIQLSPQAAPSPAGGSLDRRPERSAERTPDRRWKQQ